MPTIADRVAQAIQERSFFHTTHSRNMVLPASLLMRGRNSSGLMAMTKKGCCTARHRQVWFGMLNFGFRRSRNFILRMVICLCMSTAGLQNRIVYGSSVLLILRDCISIALENHLVLLTWQTLLSGVAISLVSPRHHNHFLFLKSILRIILFLILLLFWIIASWGDYMFQLQTHGVLPSLWIISAGLKDPSVHLAVQLQPDQSARFFGGVCRILQGLGVASVMLCCLGHGWGVRFQRRNNTTVGVDDSTNSSYYKNKDHDSQDTIELLPKAIHGNKNIDNNSRSGRVRHAKRILVGNLALLLFLHTYCGSWAPVTNLTFALIQSIVLVPHSGREFRKISQQPTRFTLASAATRPNVILVIHESLAGAALGTTRGKAATPFYQSLMLERDMYQFQYARTVAGTTTIATPAILAGLLAFDLEGVDVLKEATLAEDFKMAGYDTASFVSYGTDYYGSGWTILCDLLRHNFDHLFGPKETGEPRVNEYGMDDRKIVQYFRKWLVERQGPNATATASKSEEIQPLSSQHHESRRARVAGNSNKPFFVAIVFQNQHFPHLRHETYTGSKTNCSSLSQSSTLRTMDDGTPASTTDDAYQVQFMNDDAIDDGCWESSFDPISRYYSSLRTMDESLRETFAALNATGHLRNTIIMGAADHGETPGFQKRMGDIDAPILVPNMWMHVPQHLLPQRAFPEETRGSRKRSDTQDFTNNTLRHNTNRTVSTLDIIPTLRDLLDYGPIYTEDQKQRCVTGRSLLSEWLPQGRIVVGWGGKPLDGMNIGTFSNESKSLFYYPQDIPKSHLVELKFDDDDPFFNLFERPLKDVGKAALHEWRKALEQQGWLDHSLVKSRMPLLRNELT